MKVARVLHNYWRLMGDCSIGLLQPFWYIWQHYLLTHLTTLPFDTSDNVTFWHIWQHYIQKLFGSFIWWECTKVAIKQQHFCLHQHTHYLIWTRQKVLWCAYLIQPILCIYFKLIKKCTIIIIKPRFMTSPLRLTTDSIWLLVE